MLGFRCKGWRFLFRKARKQRRAIVSDTWMRPPFPVRCSCTSPTAARRRVDPGDYTNFDTRIEPFLRPLAASPTQVLDWVERLAEIENVTRRDHADGSVSLAVHGMEFARAGDGEVALRTRPQD